MLENILNGIPVEQFAGYAFYALLGVLISVIAQQWDNYKDITRKGGFTLPVWIKNNWRRIVVGAIAIFLGIVFMEKYSDAEPSNFGALTLGLTLDVLIDRIFNRKK